jgi:hypothetical protein
MTVDRVRMHPVAFIAPPSKAFPHIIDRFTAVSHIEKLDGPIGLCGEYSPRVIGGSTRWPQLDGARQSSRRTSMPSARGRPASSEHASRCSSERGSDVRFHDLRHRFATKANPRREPEDRLRGLGHATIGTTLDTYSHAVPTLAKQATRSSQPRHAHDQTTLGAVGCRFRLHGCPAEI